MPASLAGKSVLDVGAWDGFFSFEAERRGASRVLATDSYVWDGSHDWGSKRGFELARTALNSKVEDRVIDVLDLAPDKIGMFDPYRLGFGDLWLISGLLFLALAAWAWQCMLIALSLSLAVLAWSIGWYESSNLWDYLLDPWISIYALAVLLKRGASMATKRFFPSR